jgi:cytoskeletal protein RodZ
VTVGEALTEARNRAGLSVEELSERTKIRGMIIRGIERDDYEACGGDLYVRGYVRAIAGAVGIDAQPLVREYDLGRDGGANGGAGGSGVGGSTGRHAESYPRATPPAQAPAQRPSAPLAPAPPTGLEATRYDLPVVSPDGSVPGDPAVTAYDLPRVPDIPPSSGADSSGSPSSGAASSESPSSESASSGAAASGPGSSGSASSGSASSGSASSGAAASGPAATEFAAAESPTAEFAGLLPPAPPAPVPGAPVPGAAQTRYDLTAVPQEPSPALPEDLMAAGYDLGPAVTPADADAGTQILPVIGHGQPTPPAGTPWTAPGPASAGRKRRRGAFAVAAVVIVVALGALGYSLASRGGSSTGAAAASASTSAAASVSASAAVPAKASATAQASESAAAPSKSPASASPGAARVTRLPVTSVTAFGPDGAADGDNPGNAANAIAANPSGPWVTQWYATPEFGMLKHGTGLLLDLGGKVTVTAVRLDLPQYQGTDLQLRVGNAAALSALHVAATANQVGGTLKLTLHHPSAARYLLVWFTRLPPNGSGEYQETVSHLSVAGRR